MSLGENGAATVVLERDFNAAKLQEILMKAMGKGAMLKTMAKKTRHFGQPGAAVKLAHMVEGLLA